MGDTSIEWTDKTWSPLRVKVREDAAEIARAKGYGSLVQIAERMAGRVGPYCEHVSPGCSNCYAEANNNRCLPSNGTGLPYDRRSRDLVDPFVDEKILMQPLKWQPVRVHDQHCLKPHLGKQAACTCRDKYRFRPLRIFVENQSDLFGEWNDDEDIAQVFGIMTLCSHQFQVLTKRAVRMLELMSSKDFRQLVWVFIHELVMDMVDPNARTADDLRATAPDVTDESGWPLPNVWLGVSVEDQATADERIPLLLQTRAAVRFVSYEPALGPADFNLYTRKRCTACRELHASRYPRNTCFRCSQPVLPELDWIIIGGESGPGARPFNVQWARNTIEQCKAAGVAVFVKQLGARPGCQRADGWRELDLKDRKGGGMEEWPEDLRVREYPKGEACHTAA